MTQMVDSAIALLRGKGLRVTEQRKAILEVLAGPIHQYLRKRSMLDYLLNLVT